MKPSVFKLFYPGAAVLIGACLVCSIIFHNITITLAGMVIAFIVLAIARRGVNGVVSDERDRSLGEKAAKTTFIIFSKMMALTSVIFTLLGRKFPYLESLAIIFSYVTLSFLLLFFVSFWFHAHFGTGGQHEK